MAHPLEVEFAERYWSDQDRGRASYDSEQIQLIGQLFGISPQALERMDDTERDRLHRPAGRIRSWGRPEGRRDRPFLTGDVDGG